MMITKENNFLPGDNPNPGTVDFNLEEVSRPAMLSTTCSALNDLVMAPIPKQINK